MYYSIAIFAFTVLVGIVMILSGNVANKQKRLHTYLTDKIAEKKSARLEEQLRQQQEEEYTARVAKAAGDTAKPAAQNYAINEPSDDKLITPEARN